jgi:predicted TIM-barrel fold metal-dependent hydrolase
MCAKERIVAIEEHFVNPVLARQYSGHHKLAPFMHSAGRLEDLGAIRIREMDEAGIDVQVISHLQPGAQVFEPKMSTKMAREANNLLYEGIQVHPNRFAGFATLPTPDPEAAADELERSITDLRFRGALISGQTNGCFLDDRKFRPILRGLPRLTFQSTCIQLFRTRSSWRHITTVTDRRIIPF